MKRRQRTGLRIIENESKIRSKYLSVIQVQKETLIRFRPIAAVIGGSQAPPGRVMGHAGAWTGIGEGTAESKYKALENAGVTMVDHPAKFGGVMKDILAKSGRSVKKIVSTHEFMLYKWEAHIKQEQSAAQQRRSYHTSRFPRRPQALASNSQLFQQKRSLHLTSHQAVTLLDSYNITTSPTPSSAPASSHFVGITVARSARSPCIIAAPTTKSDQLAHRVRRFPFDYRQGPTPSVVNNAIAYLQLDAAPPKAKAQVAELISNLWKLYYEKEAVTTTVSLILSESQDEIQVYDPYLFFDDAAFKSNKRQADLHSLRDTSKVPLTELEAEKSGIVFIPLESPEFPAGTKQADTQTPPQTTSSGEPRNLVGTLVNGAGLAMNTNDVLALRLSKPPFSTSSANFLDTGGKATSETIKTSFKLILQDPRVSVVFVNIFGGLTLCDMIAEGIILAFKEVGVNKPVVVRLRGTNEEKGQEILRKANLPIKAFDDFEEAVQEVGRLANGGKA